MVLVLPSFLKKKGVAKDDTHCLVLVVNYNRLLTGYWCNQPNYLFEKEGHAHFQILY